MKKKITIIISILIVFALIFLYFRMNEDTWIRDEKGIYVKQGNPSTTPDYVLEQQRAIAQAQTFYSLAENGRVEFSSQCLGSFGDYAFDIVHSPRIPEDNLQENQCEEYKNGLVHHFIELDKDGNIVRVV